jgi:hypothetical protein
MSAFSKTLEGFCNELRMTFPEYAKLVDRAATVTPNEFWNSWKSALNVLVGRDADALFSVRRGFLVGPFVLSNATWSELSANTQGAIWKYLRTLVLESVMDLGNESLAADQSQMLLDILMAERIEAGGADAEAAAEEILEDSLNHMKPLFERLKSTMGGFMDLSGLENIPFPTIPEHLRKGRIAQLAETMAKQFKPEEFGIDPTKLTGDSIEEILRRLAEMYKNDPSLLIKGFKRVAERIRKQIEGGSLDRDALLAEAQEYVALFKDHPMFKEGIEKLNTFMGEGGLASMFGAGQSSGAPSERLRNAQDRLRKKLAARKATGKQ